MKSSTPYFQRFSRTYSLIACLLLLNACSQKSIQVSTHNQQYTVSSTFADDLAIESFISPYRDSLAVAVDRVLAVADVELTVGRSSGELAPAQVALGNFMNDAALSIARQKARELNKPAPDISIFTWGSFRKSLPVGKITLRNIYELMPFENEMVVLKLSGRQVNSLLTQLSSGLSPIGGAKMKQGDPASIVLDDGSAVGPDASYYVLASDYHAFGGDNLDVLKGAADQYLCGIKMRDAIVLYLDQLTRSNQTLKPNYDPRIKK